MLRDKSLIPLSHQHQRALALCVRIDRAQPISDSDLPAWQAEIKQLFEQEIKFHFAAEEDAIFPAAQRFPQLASLAEELLAEHDSLRALFRQIESNVEVGKTMPVLTQQLSAHIRKEERQLFEGLQSAMNAAEIASLGSRLEAALKDAVHACSVTTPATRLRAKP